MRAMTLLVATAALWTSSAVAQPASTTGASAPDPGGQQQPVTVAPRQLVIGNRPWLGDFDKLLQRRLIRVYAPFSRSLYFSDKGRERGLAVELVRDFERYLNVKHAKALGKRPLTIYVLPATRDRLLPDLEAGLADIAVGNLTVTEERLRLADFVPGDDGRRAINEIVVTGPASPKLERVEDLAGQTVHVRRTASYHESLERLSERLVRESKAPIQLVLVPDALEDEDLLDMLDAGLLQLVVVDDWKARMWTPVLPKLKARPDLVVRAEARTGWAVRKNSPLLAAEIDDFFRNWAIKQGVVAYRMNAYMKRVKELKDPTADAEYRRFRETLALFEKYGARYGFDPLMLAAQGYQESQLNQAARSHVGAIGVMQLMPATGQQMNVGDVRKIESNIHAGAKYMDHLIRQYFSTADFNEGNRPLFAFASYNCGPGNVARARREAEKRGLDPNKWFNNVEIVVSQQIGTETVTYVRNIYKYYVAYRLTLDAREQAEKARRQLAPPPRT
jgi:membrane-bound lytic murein transglycosylase MltF